MGELPGILFVATPGPLGGSNRSLLTLFEQLEGRVTRILAAPARGAFTDLVRERNLVEEYVVLPRRPHHWTDRWLRIAAGGRIAWWLVRNRRRVAAIHANALTGLNLATPAAVVSRVPVVAWIHDPTGSTWGSRHRPAGAAFGPPPPPGGGVDHGGGLGRGQRAVPPRRRRHRPQPHRPGRRGRPRALRARHGRRRRRGPGDRRLPRRGHPPEGIRPGPSCGRRPRRRAGQDPALRQPRPARQVPGDLGAARPVGLRPHRARRQAGRRAGRLRRRRHRLGGLPGRVVLPGGRRGDDERHPGGRRRHPPAP